MDISICIITKNECEKLRRCLIAAKKLGFEIVVCDTGSTDGTLLMLPEYADKICHFEWINDFAAAKNYVASQASNDFVMILDSDEYLLVDSDSREKLLKQVSQNPEKVGRIKRINDVNQNGELTKYTDYTNRIFDRRLYCFRGRIHEQLERGSVFSGEAFSGHMDLDAGEIKNESGNDEIVSKEMSGGNSAEPVYITYISGLCADHDGYIGSDEQRHAKAWRNVRLLLEELEEKPEDTYILYQTGKAYFMMEDYEKAAVYLGKALEYEVEPSYEYVIDLVESYGYALINSNQAETAVLLESVSDEFGKSADFWFMMGFAYMNTAAFDKAIAAFEKAVECKNAKMQGVDSYMAWYNEGVIYECMGQAEKAVQCYKKCDNYAKALEGINRIAALQ